MKKISILSLHLGYGGIESAVVDLANVLCKKYKVEVVCCYKMINESASFIDSRVNINYLIDDIKPNHKEIKEALKSKNIFKIIKEFCFGIKVLKLRKKMTVNYLKNTNADVLISTKDIFNSWSGKYAPSNSLKIGWEHNHYHGDLKFARKVANSAKNLDYLVLVSKSLSEFYGDLFIKYKYNCKSLYIPNMISNFPTKSALLKGNRLLSVGRLSSEKGYMDLLKVFKLLRDRGNEFYLDIVGDGLEKENLVRYINSNDLSEYVTLHGFRNKDFISNLSSKVALYVMCSFTESFGIVLVEAMSHGIPCIAYDSAEGARDLIKNDKNGYLIENRDTSLMALKIEELMKNFDKRQELGSYAREFSKQFSTTNVEKNWFDLIERRMR